MKFVEAPSLAFFNTHYESGDCRIYCRAETYSCKKVAAEKKLARSLEEAYMAKMPATGNEAGSPFGHLSLASSRKVFINLIQTLNLCFPDYDFSSLQPAQFVRENNMSLVENFINTALSAAIDNYASEISYRLWKAVDEEIRLDDSEIFSLSLDPESDPFNEEGTVWSFNYFFYNRRLRKILVFACKSVRMDCDLELPAAGEEEEDEEMDEPIFSLDDKSPFAGPQSYDKLRDAFLL